MDHAVDEVGIEVVTVADVMDYIIQSDRTLRCRGSGDRRGRGSRSRRRRRKIDLESLRQGQTLDASG
jgi:hypothetical protein